MNGAEELITLLLKQARDEKGRLHILGIQLINEQIFKMYQSENDYNSIAQK